MEHRNKGGWHLSVKGAVLYGILAILLILVLSAFSINAVIWIKGGELSSGQYFELYSGFIIGALNLSAFYTVFSLFIWRVAVGRRAEENATRPYRWAMAGGHLAALMLVIILSFPYVSGTWTQRLDQLLSPWFLEGIALVVLFADFLLLPAMLIGIALGALCGLVNNRWHGTAGFLVLAAFWLISTAGLLTVLFCSTSYQCT